MTSDPFRALTTLRQRLGVIEDLSQAVALMSWDRQTYLPPKGIDARARAVATIERLRHDRLSDPSLGDLLRELEALDLAEADAALVRETRRDADRAARLPGELVERSAQQFAMAESRWAAARASDDFFAFAPDLRENLVIAREMAHALSPDEDAYDALHDEYERDSTARQVEAVFTPLRAALVELLGEIRQTGRALDISPLRQPFDVRAQERFALGVIRDFGYDLEAGRLDRTTHPFASAIGRGDVRVTTRYDADDLRTALFSTLHEAGHGMYDQNLPAAHAGTPLGESASLSVHESQSRLWENLVGRGLPFWEGAYPALQRAFPRLATVRLEAFYAAINAVGRSLIRVEADEVTYHLHVMIRFDLERALLDGSLDVGDLSGAWAERYRQDLGIDVPDDRRGCLQDVHWAAGMIGYFPTYTLGTLLSVQLWEALRRDVPDVDDRLRRGEFAAILAWLVEHVHAHGRTLTPRGIAVRATGAEVSAEPYLRYARAKYGALYGF